MAKKKQENWTEFTVEELNERLEAEENKLQQMKFNHAISPMENPMKIRETRRGVARIKTELQKRHLANSNS